mgnify:FL=1
MEIANDMKAAPWSFSKIKSFQQCPKQFYHEKVIKQYPFKMTAAVRYGDQFHRAAEKYIQGEELDRRFEFAKPALDALNAKEGEKLCEHRMGLTKRLEACSFYDQDVWFRGIADLLIVNEADRMAWVVDYKTGKSAQYADKGQLELMALSVFRHFPQVESVKAGLLFVVCNELIREEYSVTEQKRLWSKWLEDFSYMKTAYIDEVWNPKPSGLCRMHCPVLECSHNGRN